MLSLLSACSLPQQNYHLVLFSVVVLLPRGDLVTESEHLVLCALYLLGCVGLCLLHLNQLRFNSILVLFYLQNLWIIKDCVNSLADALGVSLNLTIFESYLVLRSPNCFSCLNVFLFLLQEPVHKLATGVDLRLSVWIGMMVSGYCSQTFVADHFIHCVA